MYPCTNDKNLEMIQPLVQVGLYHILVFGFGSLVAKSRIRLDRNLVCELLLPIVVQLTSVTFKNRLSNRRQNCGIKRM
jgi:hypothetical protein